MNRFFKILIAITILSFNLNANNSDRIRIRLFSSFSSKSASFNVVQGEYYLLALDKNENTIDTITRIISKSLNSKPFTVNTVDSLISVRQSYRNLGQYQKIAFKAANDSCSFTIEYAGQNMRIYDGSLIFYHKINYLEMVNVVSMGSYIGGVVESEVGGIGNLEFYKVQALVARTYALKNINKFVAQGYNLTDDVRSQVYFSKSYLIEDSLINKAVNLTQDMVIVDQNNRLIFPAFHANSGGQTIGAEQVWVEELPYLKSKEDPYSLKYESDSIYWQKTVEKSEYLDFLYTLAPKYKENKKFIEEALRIRQQTRRSKFVYNDVSIPLRSIRDRFMLKSTFFDVEVTNNYVIFKGKGYGHGVGLSQIGAKNMAKEGYKCEDIINFYFNGVKIINFHMLNTQ